MRCSCDECRAQAQQTPLGFNGAARRHRTRQRKVVAASAPLVEAPLLDVTAWPSADLWIDPQGQASLIGATVRLYAVAEEVRTIEASLTIQDVSSGIRLSGAARGCTRWEATIAWPAGATTTTSVQPIVVVLVSFDAAAASAPQLAPQGGGAPPQGRASWYSMAATSYAGQIKAGPGALWQLAATNAGATATWLMVFDALAPAAGATPVMRAYVPALSVASWVLTDAQDPSPPGRPFSVGIAWAASSTADILTPIPSATFDVAAKYE